MIISKEIFDDLNNCVYLDSAATSFVSPEVLNAMLPYFNYKAFSGNPSSKHDLGLMAKNAIDESREIIASSINAQPSEIYFTSGGSEANNWVIKGLKNRFKVRPAHIISSSFEHHSITESLKYRCNESEDIEYTLVQPDKDGVISVESVADMFKLNTVLVSIMHVNNEIGTIQPIKDIAEHCLDNGIIFHTDAVQSFGQLPIDVQQQHIALMSMAAHKIHGPKGVGALYISNDVKGRILSFIHGGHQERGYRTSTENVPGIIGFGKAVELAVKDMENNRLHEIALRNHLLDRVMKIPDIHLNGNKKYMDPRHVNLRVDGVRAEELIELLNSVHVFVSSGSACNSESKEPSQVLKAIGLTDDEANSSIRVSIGGQNTMDEINIFVDYLNEFVKVLREKK